MKFLHPSEYEDRESILVQMAKLSISISKYTSGKLSLEELDKIEAEIFSEIILARLVSAIKDNYSKSKIEKELSSIHGKIDSTNELLKTIVLLLDKDVNDKHN